MKNKIIRKFSALLISLLAVTGNSCTKTVKAATLTDFIANYELNNNLSIIADNNDTLNLLNLALLNDVDILSIKYRNKTLIDVLDEKQLDLYNANKSIIDLYKQSLYNAKQSLLMGLNAEAVIEQVDEVYSLYNNYIKSDVFSKEIDTELETVILTRIIDCIERNADIGDFEKVASILSNYNLQTFYAEQTEDEKYQCVETTWNTNNSTFQALFNGMIISIEDNSIITSIGGTQHPLLVSYYCDDKLILADDSLTAGITVEQGQDLLAKNNKNIRVTLSCNNKNIDLLKIIGPTAKLLVNEYKRHTTENSNEVREVYIQYLLSSRMKTY